MIENKITVVGSDKRLDYTAKKLAESGFEVQMIKSNAELEDAGIFGTLILPLPYTAENTTVKGTDIFPSDLISHLDKSSRVILGKADEFIERASRAIGFSFTDINADAVFKYQNAVPSAEAALRIAMESSETTLSGKEIMVLGFGCIAKRLVGLLAGFNTDITVVCRNSADRILAAMCGCEALPFESMKCVIGNKDIIFNTCPANVLPQDILDAVKKDCVIIDLASRPGGCDFAYAALKGINAKLYLGLPDKYYPATSRKDHFEAVLRAINGTAK